MVNINPITENFKETINNTDNITIQNDQARDQLLESKTVNNNPTILNRPSEVINNYALINNVTDKESLEAKNIKNELIAINIFAIIGIIISSLLFVNQALSASNIKNIFNIDNFINISDILLYLFILKKSDIARKLIIIVEVITILLSLLVVFAMNIFSGSSATTLIRLMPSILFAILVICFFSSSRIKRHFA